MIWLFLASLFSLLLIGVPIAISMLISAVVMLVSLGLFDTGILGEYLIKGANSFSLMAIPFFILTGEIMNAGGVSRRIVDFASSLVGHIRGGLGYVVIISGVIFAGLSGSAVADTAALGAILIPMMIAKGYNKNRATGLTAATGILGTIIPPSIPMILFGVVGGVSISKLFMAGIVPGLLMAVGLMVVWYFVSKRDNSDTLPKATSQERWVALKRAFLALLLPVIIIVGLRGGVFTPTEAGVVAAVYAFIISLIYRELKWTEIPKVFVETAKTTGVVMFVAATAIVSGYAITVGQVPRELGEFLSNITTNPTLLLVIIMLFLLIVGCVMDLTPAILIFTPVLLPVVKAVGIDPVYFGLLMVINLSIGLITPPVGTVLYVGCGISKISIIDITKGIFPFLLVQMAILFLLVLFPGIVTVPLEFFTE
ncbi:L-dehydroascorbate transporter large permease subunit [Bacillus canaveralius]|uniref:L-dehydroascorbate transporter large permease subunit n=1 Tax=Bacillus canaveralius TaxID=1403243 RepID=A0A2N5GK09_9BACI|nr:MULTISPECIES: TRAP transporter large permease [Bacillus]PLR81660.1 L-dehydroascorbate transporter large permease subunit [Bacillus canaveralius]PLR87726.1 L-dehydroascorbate transporter large permease subunit [Bacillus sp. V33-4]PLR89876.1 L-dehydroascorbate transporter large permease subunit [Bacillus canaveralius]RSK55171.1 TRAP transporter large permease [Bacillus canaveralius]